MSAFKVASGKPKRKHCSKRISHEQEEKENTQKSTLFKQMPPRRAPVFLLSPGINTRGTSLRPCWIYSMSRGLVSTNQTFFASEAWILASYKLAALIFTLYIRWCPLWRHTVVWCHGAFFVSRQHSTATKVFMKGLFIVCETVFAIGESQRISHAS